MLQISGYFSDLIISKGLLTIIQTRKSFLFVACSAQTVCLLCAAFFLGRVSSITFITIGITFSSFIYTSVVVNYIDIAPQFAGVLMGICNSSSVVAGIISPIVTGYIVTDRVKDWEILLETI